MIGATRSVRVNPGRIPLTRTQDGPNSSAASSNRWSSAALLTPYAPNQRWVLLDAMDDMPTNDPPPPRTSSRAPCLSRYMLPLTLRSTVRRHAAESVWVSGPIVSDPPALCTMPCNRPFHEVAAATIRPTSSSSVMSAGAQRTIPACAPAASAISSAAAARRSGSRPTIITSPPAAATVAATPFPMPLPPPVMRTVRLVIDRCTTTPRQKLEHVLSIEPWPSRCAHRFRIP